MTSNKFYFDTEFIEGFRKPIWWLPTIFGFNKSRWFIELISIAIVSHDDRKYYAVSTEFNRRHANQWVKDNVISKLPPRVLYEADPDYEVNKYTPGYNGGVVGIENPLYKSNKQIARDIYAFVAPVIADMAGSSPIDDAIPVIFNYLKAYPPTFIAYYADYDWVMLCTLFGTMMDLPKGFPMYCVDMKQELDRVVWNRVDSMMQEPSDVRPEFTLGQLAWRDGAFKNVLIQIKSLADYPKQESEHDAQDDAMFVKNLHNFILKYKT